MRRGAAALFLLAAAADLAAQATLVTNVSVVPMDREVVLERHAVLVESGKITFVGEASAIGEGTDRPLPEGTVVVDGGGGFVIPGLADMHVHLNAEHDLTLAVAHGVTTVRNMFGSSMQLAWRDEIAAGARFGPTIVTAGPIVDGAPPTWPGSRVVKSADDAREAVREQVAEGYDFVKVYSGVQPDAYAALLAEAAALGVAVDGHVPAAIDVFDAIDAGQRTVEHLIGFETPLEAADAPTAGKPGHLARLRAWQHVDEKRVPDVVFRTTASRAWVCPTLIVMEKWLDPEEAARERELPEMKGVAPFVLWYWQSMANGIPKEMREAGRAGAGPRREFTRALYEGGARILLGTDAGNPWVVPGPSALRELEIFVACGMTPFDALRSATVLPAECLGQRDRFGAVKPGLRADLVLLAANPLDDVTNVAKRKGVLLRGTWYPEAELRARLDALNDE